ncbi:MAG: hypothetical protein WC350_04895 [Candidatus Micrarchaeia archaeon]|jgi:hypothetical protein
MVKEKEKVIKLLKFIKSRCKIRDPFGGDLLNMFMFQDKYIFFSKSCSGQLVMLIDILQKRAKRTRKLISREKITDLVQLSILNILHNNSDPLRETTKIFAEMSLTHKKFRVLIPIGNLRIAEQIDLGSIRLIPFVSKEEFFSMGYSEIDDEIKDFIYTQFSEQFGDDKRTWTLAEVTTFAVDADKARRNAFDLAELTLSFLRLFNNVNVIYLPHKKLMIVNLNTIVVAGNQILPSYSWHNQDINSYNIDSRMLARIQPHLTSFKTLLSKGKLTKFDEAILLAIKWAGDAVIEQSNPMKLLKCIISLETIMQIESRTNKQEHFATGIIHLLYSRSTTRVKGRVMKFAKSIYKARSSTVHAGVVPYLLPTDIAQIDLWSRSIAQLALVKGVGKSKIDDIF